MVLGAIAKALAGGAAKAARARKKGDDVYNARRRYNRRADRLEKQAAKESGAAGERLRLQAEENRKKALSLYENKRDQERYAEKHDLAIPRKELSEAAHGKLMKESSSTLESALSGKETRREREAREILNSRVGSRIYAATRDIWAGEYAESQDLATINRKIMDKFGVDSMADVIALFEKELGEELYKDPGNVQRYDEVVAAAKRLTRQVMRNG